MFVDILNTIKEEGPLKDVYEGGRLVDLDIPSPYLTGVFDDIIANNEGYVFNGTLETNRGCPFACTFCDWGGVARSKISKLEDSLVNETIEYILKFKSVKRLEILDANFGIFERDKHLSLIHISEPKRQAEIT